MKSFNSIISYQQITPAEQLRRYVRHVWTIEGTVSLLAPTTFKVIADGCPGILFLENPSVFSDNNHTSSPHLMLHKSASTYAEINMQQGQLNLIAIQLHPAAIKAIFGIDAHTLTEAGLDLELISDRQLTEQLLNKPSNAARIELLTSFLIEKLNKNQSQKINKALHAVDLLQVGNFVPTLKDLQTKLNLTERSQERLFNQNIGISPKVFARIVRFQKALDEMRGKKFSTLTELAYKHHYADQSHFIREFQEFTGTSPFHFLKQANEQMENFAEWHR